MRPCKYLTLCNAIHIFISDFPIRCESVNKYLTRTSYFGQVTDMDAQGRVVINPLLRESARIAGEVAVLGYLNYLEVWNNELFRERVLDQPLTAEDRRVLAELGL